MFWTITALIFVLVFLSSPVFALILALVIFIACGVVVLVGRLLQERFSVADVFKASVIAQLVMALGMMVVVMTSSGHTVGLSGNFFVATAVVLLFSLFVYARYLRVSMVKAFVIMVLSGMVSSAGLWVAGKTSSDHPSSVKISI